MPRPAPPSSRLLLALVVALYAIIVAVQSNLKLLWTDELITFYIARQPGVRGVWHALRAGADPNPPLTHLLVKLAIHLFGPHAWAMRLPGELCVLLAILSLWSILRRSLPPVFSAAGVLAFMATRGFDYACDARSYALMLGFTFAALALYLHSNDQTGRRRALTLAAMALSLIAAISSNYYCVLALFPIAAAELTQTRVPHISHLRCGKDNPDPSRRFRPEIWLTLLLAGLPIFAYLPLIQHNISEFTPHAWNRPHPAMLAHSYFELVEGVFWPVLALALYVLFKRRPGISAPRAELAAIITLLLYPFLGYAIALAGAGMISARCVVAVCGGFALAFALLAHHLFAQRPGIARGIVAALVVWVAIRETIGAKVLLEQRDAFFTLRDQVAQTTGPILAADSSFELTLYFYSAPAVRSRIVVPIDFPAVHRYQKDDSGEENLWAGRNSVFPFPVVPFDQLRLEPRETLIADPGGWLAILLRARGYTLTPIPQTTAAWTRTGGIFNPMSHPETRILIASKSNH